MKINQLATLPHQVDEPYCAPACKLFLVRLSQNILQGSIDPYDDDNDPLNP